MAKADPMPMMNRRSDISVQTAWARLKVTTALDRRCQAIVLTNKAVKCHNPKEDAAATVVAFVPNNVQPMPFRSLTLRRLTLPSAYPA